MNIERGIGNMLWVIYNVFYISFPQISQINAEKQSAKISVISGRKKFK